MNLRRLLRPFIPPIVISVAQRQPLLPWQYVWKGIYKNYREVPVRRGNYDDDTEIKKHSSWTRAALASVRAGQSPTLWHRPLALLAGMVASEKNSVSVLDFGGAIGLAYVHLLGGLPEKTAIDYRVIELEKMCIAGRQVFKGDTRIKFETAIPAWRPDIVYLSDVLCYVEDYSEFLTKIASIGAEFILFTRLAAGNVPTYATQQRNLRDKLLAYWIINRSEIVDALAAAGYHLIYDQSDDKGCDQQNFPEAYRIGNMRVMLFRHLTNAGSHS